MKLLDLIIQEYVSIVDKLLDKEPIENNRIIIDKERFKEILEKYHYLKFNQKTQIYKDLNLIIHDENNYTMPVKDTDTKKTVRKVVFNYNTYLTIKNLFETNVDL